MRFSRTNRFMLGDVSADMAAPVDMSGAVSSITDVFGTALDDFAQYKTTQAQTDLALQQSQMAAQNAKNTQALMVGAALLLALLLVVKR